MKHGDKGLKKGQLPEMFRSLMWSYRFEKIDPDKHYKEIIVNTVNYGDIKHWRWLVSNYGGQRLREVLRSVPVTEFRPRVLKLVGLLFGLKPNEFNHAPRGTN